ncbi:transposase family protein [Streptomyces sp. NPDC001568]|uniref:transposase family protein n=1 Tax=Streptomyces sp. NPDC001568 TaxID=3364588 RepID=UPI0036B6A40D
MSARCIAATARCPGCGTVSVRVHSRYGRRLADAAVGGREVAIDLEVRRFFCDNADCVKKTFAEQVERLTFRYGRGTRTCNASWDTSRWRWVDRPANASPHGWPSP